MKKVIVVGGGASGIMAAIFAAKSGFDVTVLEQNEKPLKKLHATGNGRCNLTNECWSDRTCLRSDKIDRPYSYIKQFDSEKTIEFFESIGILTKSRSGWVYPLNDSAAAVANALLFEAECRKVKIKTNQKVLKIKKNNDVFSVDVAGWTYSCDKVIISTGGQASVNNDGYILIKSIADSFGISYIRQLPSLVALKLKNDRLSMWSGVRTDAIVSLYINEKYITAEKGEVQLTNNGISGIPIFQLSRYAVKALNNNQSVNILIDFLPAYSEKEIKNFISKVQSRYKDKTLKNILSGIVPEKLAFFIVGLKTKQSAERLLKSCSFKVTGFGEFKTAQCTSGGIALTEINNSLESVKCPGLYFTGEALDVDGKCGGYNLQWAWSTGWIAGTSLG